ncbi:MAG: hypothetical protein KKE44_21570 [Proteobacteria bacterium]|nr:hypothetical protein [Pseudomonadota bacterium]MBU1585324.1 hypothetical protein [Pseudomonadota bacterium]MBU2455494.1 hypothetical protein [Pseudomonadota bacterium]MBU2631736.1 hypothetical protein [Pseudomonadota bacterium]
MKTITKISFICFLIICIGEMLIAFRFLTASQIMDYHQVAMGCSWDNLPAGMQTMTLNFLRTAGLGFLITGLAILFILIFPFQRGEHWSKWALVSIGLVQSIIMGIIVYSVRRHTPATPPLSPFVISGILSFIGFLTYQGTKSSI